MNYSNLDDEALFRHIARAQSDALSELYDRYGRLVYSVALGIVGEQSIAEEVTQDTFLRAWKHAHRYQSSQGKATTWLISITRNGAIDALRRQQARPEGHSASWDDLPVFDPPSAENIETDFELVTQKQRVRQALASLSDEQRVTLALAYFRGLTQEEIAKNLRLPLGTVKTRMRLAMQRLRQFLQGDEML
jgi:RNA polymerase sigma-70 factor (ECF subfamily)